MSTITQAQSIQVTDNVSTHTILFWRIFFPLWICYSYLTYYFRFTCDDAYITFRYARNLAHGFGPIYNIGSAPTEGYSNFLWMLVAAAAEYIQLDTPRIMNIVAWLSGSCLLWFICEMLHTKFKVTLRKTFFSAAFFALLPPVAVWSTSGLETMPFALLIFLVFRFSRWPAKQSSLLLLATLGLMLALIRPEGLLWFYVVLILVSIFPAAETRRAHCGIAALFVTCAFIPYLFWRHSFYGSWLPNTVAAKVGINTFEKFGRGVDYFSLFLISFPAIFVAYIASGIATLRARAPLLPIFALALAFPAYAIVLGGDFMAMGRFLIPGFAFLVICLAHARVRIFWGVLLIALNLTPTFNIYLVPRDLLGNFRFRYNTKAFRTETEQWQFMKKNSERWAALGKALATVTQPDESLVAGAVGAIGYYSNLVILDRFGLVAREVALAPVTRRRRSPGHDKAVPPAFFLPKNPTYLDARLVRNRKQRDKLINFTESWSKGPEYRDYKVELRSSPDGEVLVLARSLVSKPSNKCGGGCNVLPF